MVKSVRTVNRNNTKICSNLLKSVKIDNIIELFDFANGRQRVLLFFRELF